MNLAEIIKITAMFIKANFKDSKKVKEVEIVYQNAIGGLFGTPIREQPKKKPILSRVNNEHPYKNLCRNFKFSLKNN